MFVNVSSQLAPNQAGFLNIIVTDTPFAGTFRSRQRVGNARISSKWDKPHPTNHPSGQSDNSTNHRTRGVNIGLSKGDVRYVTPTTDVKWFSF